MNETITGFIESYGLVSIVILMFAETVIPVIPSEIIMPYAGFAAAKGTLSLPWVIAGGTLGSGLGALVLYYIARHIPERLIYRFFEKYGRYIGLKASDIQRGDKWFDSHANWSVLIGRVIPGIRSAVSIPAGIRRMPVGRFTALTFIGSSLWTTILVIAGYTLGERYEEVERFVGPIGITAAIVIVGLIVISVVRSRRKAAR